MGNGVFNIPNDFDFNEEVSSTHKNDTVTRIGYVYQENTISHTLPNLNPKEKFAKK